LVYKEIELSKVLPNPFQTRKHIDEDKIDQLAGTIDDKLGIRNAPLIRSHPTRSGFYEIGSGWRRVLAARKKGIQTGILRVEDLTDSEMKTEVLVENVNRVDFDDDELYNALEQVRTDQELDMSRFGDLKKLSIATGIPRERISDIYEARKLTEKIGVRIPIGITQVTQGLPDEERIALIKKAQEKHWDKESVANVRTALKKMEPEARVETLKPETHITPEVIKKIAELPKEIQRDVIKETRIRRLNEPDALKMVERVREGKQPQIDRTIDEAKETLEDFTETLLHVKTWGINQYGILGPAKWDQACELFTRMEDHLRWLRMRGWESKV